MNRQLVTIFIAITLTIPLFIAILFNTAIFSFAPGEIGDWIGFWGSYLGAIVSISGVLYTTYLLIENERKKTSKADLQNDVKKVREMIINKSVKELHYINNSIRNFESVASLWHKFFCESSPNVEEYKVELYVLMSEWKNNLKAEEYVLQIEIEQLQFMLLFLEKREMEFSSIYLYTVKMYSYLEHGQHFYSTIDAINKSIWKSADVNRMKKIVSNYFLSGGGDLVETHINCFQSILNEVQNENREFLKKLYLN